MRIVKQILFSLLTLWLDSVLAGVCCHCCSSVCWCFFATW